ncbi:hypothetical protein CLU79DRAFT_891279 [Phycomyces nitens]|nr:hypothetical protein CLU79DRAFT_891279 [Phycomyces nitens]
MPTRASDDSIEDSLTPYQRKSWGVFYLYQTKASVKKIASVVELSQDDVKKIIECIKETGEPYPQKTCHLTADLMLWVFPAVLLPSGSTPVLSNLRTSAYAKARMLTSISARHHLRQGNPATVNSTNERIHPFIDRRWLTDRRAIRSLINLSVFEL